MSSINIKWSEYEINFLKENYRKYGTSYCAKELKRTIRGCSSKAKKLNIKFNKLKEYYEKDNLLENIKISYTYTECIKNIGLTISPGNFDTLKKYIKLYDIDISHFHTTHTSSMNKYVVNKIKIPMCEILVTNSTYKSSNLKRRLYKEGFKTPICEMCGQDEIWNGKKMSLILDHINGVNDDNRLINLRILCPNCNATLDTHCRGSVKINKSKVILCKCGNKKDRKSSNCKKCDSINQRKVKERPTYELLKDNIKEIGYKATGEIYKVSDNTIRKWIKQYEQ